MGYSCNVSDGPGPRPSKPQGRHMARFAKDEIKAKVSCSSLLESDGWKVDLRESTSKSIKYRRGEGEIIIVIHQGRGWFDPTSEAKGDVFSLAERLGATDFNSALKVVADLVGYEPSAPAWQRRARRHPAAAVAKRWSDRPRPTPGSGAWTYLTKVRALPDEIVSKVVAADRLREGPRGSIWAAHVDLTGRIVGWEERGRDWQGFATGGGKALFCVGDDDGARRLCVTEAAIDAMSLAALEGCRPDSLYTSTAGGWAPATETRIRAFASRPGAQLVAAFDGDDQGDTYAARLMGIAKAAGAVFLRLWPAALDWNQQILQSSNR